MRRKAEGSKGEGAQGSVRIRPAGSSGSTSIHRAVESTGVGMRVGEMTKQFDGI